jgi:hypothetical protein
MSAPISKENVIDFKAKSGLRERMGQSVTLSVSPELVEKIKELAELTGDKNVSRVVNRLLFEGLNDIELSMRK